MSGGIPGESPSPTRWWQRVEVGVLILVLGLMVALPVYAVLVRWTTGAAMPGANLWVQALNLWIAFLGGALAARTGQHLALSTASVLKLDERVQRGLQIFTSAVATAVTAMLAYASFRLVQVETASTQTLYGGVPMWVMQAVMPLGFAIMAGRFAWRQESGWSGRAAAAAAVLAVALLAFVPPGEREWVVWAGAAVLLAAVAFGAPLFTGMGGMAMLLFYGAPVPISLSAVPAETVRLVSDPSLAALPLFTLAGYVLAEGGASKRLVALFNAWFGWLPGGVAAASVLVCAFFTTFTGASGVTILALGGLLLPALEAAGYPRRFAIGLLVASGSIGLLFPPSLPVILYGVASRVPITDLFMGGLVPGLVLVSLLVTMGLVVDLRQNGLVAYLPAAGGGVRTSAGERLSEMGRAAWRAKFELLIPLLVVGGIFGGYLTIFESAAFTAAYALFIEVVVHRDLSLREGVPRAFQETIALMGGVLVILGVALGFTSYLVDAEIPLAVRDWVQAGVTNRLVFLLLLNLLLLLVGCLMDIFSAIVVVVPLILPVAELFGIHPVHLGILFLANLELGYLTPPVGLNLFLASFRFKEPLTAVYRYALPFLGVMALGVLLITYVPQLTLWPFADTSPTQAPDFFEELEGEEPAPPPEALTPEELQRLLEEEL